MYKKTMMNKIISKIAGVFRAVWREFWSGSYVTFVSVAVFGVLLGIFVKRFTQYPDNVNDWISWLVLWISIGAWLRISFRASARMEIKIDADHSALPPKPRISHELDRKGTLYIDTVLNFINRSSINNSIVGETYLVSGNNKEYAPARKKTGNGPGFIKEINLPDVYRPYTARKHRVSLTVEKKYIHGILENGDKYRIKFIYEPINGKHITVTAEKEIDTLLKEKYKSL